MLSHDMLANAIKDYVDELESPCYIHHSDFDGCAAQAIANMIENIKGRKGRYREIDYLHTQRAVEFALKHKPEEIVFLDYEPHRNEFDKICEDAKKILILGHHIRPDIKYLEEEDDRVTYLNPRDFVDPGLIKKGVKREGLPITYFMHKAAELYGIGAESSFAASVGLRGYGFSNLAKEIEERYRLNPNGRIDNYISEGLMLISYRFSNCNILVNALEESKSYQINRMNLITEKLKNPDINYKYLMMLNSTYGNIKMFSEGKKKGDLIIYMMKPINGDHFDQTKIFLYDRKGKGFYNFAQELGLNTILVINYINGLRKASIRSRRSDINVADILEKTFEKVKTEKNFGGHENSGGFVCIGNDDLKDITRNFTETYFAETGQEIDITDEDLSDLKL